MQQNFILKAPKRSERNNKSEHQFIETLYENLDVLYAKVVADTQNIDRLRVRGNYGKREFDKNVFVKRKSWVEVTDQKMSAQSSETPGLTDQDRALLTDDYFVQIAGQYGYQIDI